MNKTTLLKLVTLALPVLAQTTGFAQTTVKEALVKHWKVTGDFTIKVAQAMPAESYNYRPVPEELSFGQLMGQIGHANANACATASGMKAPAVPEKVNASGKDPDVLDKASAIQYLTATFDFCNQAVAAMTPEKFDAAGPRSMTGFEWLWSYFTHTAHHRGQAEVYLRMKGIVPPTYTF
jgi:uncharacterized damage-inducible protein DinB